MTAISTCNASERMSAGADSPQAGVLREFYRRYCQRSKAPSEYLGTIPFGGPEIRPPSTQLPSDADYLSAYASRFYSESNKIFSPEEMLTLKRFLASAMRGNLCDVDVMVTVLGHLEKANYRDHLAMATHLDNLTPEERQVVFRLATRMAACTGGNPACAPGGLLTLSYCMRRFMCTPSLSLMEAYRLTNSPLVFDSAKQIADYYANFPTQSVVVR
jgi:hypothetical protein